MAILRKKCRRSSAFITDRFLFDCAQMYNFCQNVPQTDESRRKFITFSVWLFIRRLFHVRPITLDFTLMVPILQLPTLN